MTDKIDRHGHHAGRDVEQAHGDVEAFLDLIDAKSLADAWTTSDDVATSKPEPDIVATAPARVDGASGIMIGDSVFDAQAAAKLNIPVIGVRTGGFSVGELQEAGVLQVFDSLVAFRHALDGTPLARARRRATQCRTLMLLRHR